MDTSFQYEGATKKETVENHLKKSCNIVMHILLQGRMKRKKRQKYSDYKFLEHLQHYDIFWKDNEHNLTQY